MKSFNIHYAKTHLSQLVDKAVSGESFVIAKSGKPLVKVLPIGANEQLKKKRLGFLMGHAVVVPSQEEFDTIGADEIARMFEGDE